MHLFVCAYCSAFKGYCFDLCVVAPLSCSLRRRTLQHFSFSFCSLLFLLPFCLCFFSLSFSFGSPKETTSESLATFASFFGLFYRRASQRRDKISLGCLFLYFVAWEEKKRNSEFVRLSVHRSLSRQKTISIRAETKKRGEGCSRQASGSSCRVAPLDDGTSVVGAGVPSRASKSTKASGAKYSSPAKNEPVEHHAEKQHETNEKKKRTNRRC